jgi:excisionase family DNA binding protein
MSIAGDDFLLTVDDVAALLRTSRKAVYTMTGRGQLPGVTRIGRRLLFRREDLLGFLDERRAPTPGSSRRW